MEALRWAWEHSCPHNDATSDCATQDGHLDELKWARQHAQ